MTERIIKASIPKNFVLLIEETFYQNGDPIFILENTKTKKRLYAIISEVDGCSWEFLLPDELRKMNIEESFNEVLYSGDKEKIEESGGFEIVE